MKLPQDARRWGKDPSIEIKHFFQRLSVSLQQGNAALLIDRDREPHTARGPVSLISFYPIFPVLISLYCCICSSYSPKNSNFYCIVQFSHCCFPSSLLAERGLSHHYYLFWALDKILVFLPCHEKLDALFTFDYKVFVFLRGCAGIYKLGESTLFTQSFHQ